jgi:hypothetical protein
MKLFFYDLDDLHQLDFAHHQQMVREIERLRVRSTTIDQQRESWKVRALMAEAQLFEATAKTSTNGGSQKVSDLRYASLKCYLAKRFHPDYAPGQGIETSAGLPSPIRDLFDCQHWGKTDPQPGKGGEKPCQLAPDVAVSIIAKSTRQYTDKENRLSYH